MNHKVDFPNTQIAFAYKNTKQLLNAYFIFFLIRSTRIVKWGTFLIERLLYIRFPLVRKIIRYTLFSHFCGGESLSETKKIVDILAHFKIGFIADYAVEDMSDNTSFDNAEKEIVQGILYASKRPSNIPFCVFKMTALSTSQLLERIQENRILNKIDKEKFQQLQKRIENICNFAYKKKVRLLIDAEGSWIQKTIDSLVSQMMKRYNTKEVIIYNTYQMYLKNTYDKLVSDIEEAKRDGYRIGIKLVRGAYLKEETEIALRKKIASPLQPSKTACDNFYNRALLFSLKNREYTALCAGTHNEESCALLASIIHKFDIPHGDTRFFFAQLYGMSDHISFNLAKDGYNVAKYVPYGPIHSVLPYLFRRADENTSVTEQTNREYKQVYRELKRRWKALKK